MTIVSMKFNLMDRPRAIFSPDVVFLYVPKCSIFVFIRFQFYDLL